MNGLTADTQTRNIIPWWKSAMIAINVVIGVLLLGSVTCFVLWGYVFKKNDVIEVCEGNDTVAGGEGNE